jgi:hypothetical protein
VSAPSLCSSCSSCPAAAIDSKSVTDLQRFHDRDSARSIRIGWSSCAARRTSKRNKDDDGAVGMEEVVRLKREQRAIEDRVAAMWRRVQETERRPKQMLAFLLKVAGDPQVLCRLLGARARRGGHQAGEDAGFDASTSGY